MTETKTPTPLTAAEIEARKQIMAAADTAKQATPSAPQNAPVKPADVAKPAPATPSVPVTAAAPATPEKPAMVPPTGTTTATQGAGSKGAGSKGGAAANPTTAGGKQPPATGQVTNMARQQGGGSKGTKSGTKSGKAPDVANEVYGFDLTRWPQWAASVKPSKAELAFANFLLVNRNGPTKKLLAAATYLRPQARDFNAYDLAYCYQKVCGGSVDHKFNVVNEQLLPQGYYKKLDVPPQPYKNPDNTGANKPRVCYPCELTAKARAALGYYPATASSPAGYKYLDTLGIKCPAYLLPPADSK